MLILKEGGKYKILCEDVKVKPLKSVFSRIPEITIC